MATVGGTKQPSFEQGEIVVTVLTGRHVQIIEVLDNGEIGGYLGEAYWVRFEDYSFKKLAWFELQKRLI